MFLSATDRNDAPFVFKGLFFSSLECVFTPKKRGAAFWSDWKRVDSVRVHPRPAFILTFRLFNCSHVCAQKTQFLFFFILVTRARKALEAPPGLLK